MEKLKVYSACCSRGWKAARILAREVESRTGVQLRLCFLSYGSNIEEYARMGYSYEMISKDPMMRFANWECPASRSNDPVEVDKLCGIVTGKTQQS